MAQDRQPERREPPGHGSTNRGRRAPLAAMAAAALLGLVAVGALRGPLGGGRGRPHYPADLVDSLLLLLFVAMVAAGVLGVVSLWPVDDVVACVTMVIFHEELLKGEPPAVALASAQRAVADVGGS